MLHNEKFRYRVLLLVRGNKDALVLFLYVCFPHRIRKEDRTMKHPVMLANMPDGRSIAGWSVFWCHMDPELFCRASCRFLVKFEMTDSLSLSLSLPHAQSPISIPVELQYIIQAAACSRCNFMDCRQSLRRISKVNVTRPKNFNFSR